MPVPTVKKPLAAASPDPGLGITCRSCGCRHFYVIYTRRAAGGKLVRRRECRHCGKRITTVEEEK